MKKEFKEKEVAICCKEAGKACSGKSGGPIYYQ
jgi:hypothetical protein